ncbi:MAG: flagellar hook assembly protein FlgD [Pseudomonadota bacterium]
MNINQTAYGNSSINKLFTGHTEEVAEKKDPLGREAFLTMLVAQLRHQDPLNPMEGTDFTAQLAQFSSLEQQFSTNKSLEAILDALATKTQENLIDFIGKEVVGESNSISISKGNATTGYYTIDDAADVSIAIYDSKGSLMQNIYAGQKDSGTHKIDWDGKNLEGGPVPDGAYTFEILALSDIGGYVEAKTAVEGKVTGVTYEHDIPYLQIGERLLDPSTITKILLPQETKEEESIEST